MSKVMGALLLLLAGAIAADPTAAEGGRNGVCRGMPAIAFERRFPEQMQRYAFDGKLLKPFIRLWQATRRPDLPTSPERVTVYALPGHPYLVGYQSQGCLIAFLAVQRQKLWSLLRPQIGWPA